MTDYLLYVGHTDRRYYGADYHREKVIKNVDINTARVIAISMMTTRFRFSVDVFRLSPDKKSKTYLGRVHEWKYLEDGHGCDISKRYMGWWDKNGKRYILYNDGHIREIYHVDPIMSD